MINTFAAYLLVVDITLGDQWLSGFARAFVVIYKAFLMYCIDYAEFWRSKWKVGGLVS